MQKVSKSMMERFENYVSTLENSKEQSLHLDSKREELLRQMEQSNQEQALYLQQLKGYQAKLENALKDFALWSERSMSNLSKETQLTTEELSSVSTKMRKDGEVLAGSYSTFVENITEGLSRSLGMFDQNIHQVMNELNQSLTRIEKVMGGKDVSSTEVGENHTYVSELSSIQQSLTSIEKALSNKNTSELLQKQNPPLAKTKEGK